MKTTTTITITLLIMAIAGQAYTACNNTAFDVLIKAAAANVKVEDNEVALPTATLQASVATTGFVDGKACYKIWTDAQGTCCKQDEIQARADALVEKIKARMNRRFEMIREGKADILDKLEEIKTKIAAKKAKAEGKGTAAAKITELVTTIDKLIANKAKDEALQKKALDNLPACTKAIVENRIKVWCLACANTGGSPLNTANLIGADGKIEINPAACGTIIEQCADVYAFFRKVRGGDRIMRAFRKALNGKDKPNAPGLTKNTDAELDADQKCVDDIAKCKNETGQRNAFCNRFKLNRDDDRTFPDKGYGEVKPGNFDEEENRRILQRNFLNQERRILQTNSADGTANVSANGADLNNLNAGYQVDISNFSYSNILNAAIVLVASIFLSM